MAPRTSGRARLGTPGRRNTPAMAVGLRNTSSSIFNSNLMEKEKQQRNLGLKKEENKENYLQGKGGKKL